MIGSAAAISGGLSTIYSNEHVQLLFGLRDRFMSLQDLSADHHAHSMVASWFDRFEIEMPWSDTSNSIVVPLPGSVYANLCGLEEELGISRPTLAKICMMITLCAQVEVLDGYREAMSRFIDSFWERAFLRAAGTRALLDVYGL